MFQQTRRRSISSREASPAIVQTCERRTLLAGNVTISFTGPNTILIQGDGSDNSIEYISFGSQVIIQGLNGTRVNGTPDGTGMPNRVLLTDELGRIYLGNGLLWVTVDLGAGNDSFRSVETFYGGIMFVGGPGNDSTSLGYGFAGSLIYGWFGVDDPGNDVLEINHFSSQTHINLGSGNDRLRYTNTDLQEIVHMEGGSGNDLFEIQGLDVSALDGFLLNVGSGNDTVSVSDSHLKNTNFDLGSGLDRLYFTNTWIEGATYVQLGAGNDSFVSNSLTTHAFVLDAGAGMDTLQVDLSASMVILEGGDGIDLMILNQLRTSGDSTIRAGAGNDVVAILNTALGGQLLVDGGTGRDTLYRSSVAGIGFTGFEVPLSIWTPSIWLAGRFL